ncbi:MAG: thioredoxin family protein [Chromatiales bacterium]|nr:thioredoxin family protein [Chromatiales bacterium]
MAEAFEPIEELDDFHVRLREQAGVLAYFSTQSCNVCKSLKPKIGELIERQFPQMSTVYVDCELSPAIAGQYQVFAVPTILGFFDGREWLRKGRAVSMAELAAELKRPYDLLFDNSGS